MREYLLATLCAAILVFIAFFGAYSGSAWREPSSVPQRHYELSYRPNNNPEGITGESQEEVWKKIVGRTFKDPVAFYTAILAIFTGVLSTVSVVQIWFLIRSDKTARLAAEAANLNAKTAIGAESPIISLLQIRLLNVEPPDHNIVGYPPKETIFNINFHNFGRSPAEAVAVCIEWAVAVRLPAVPIYKTISPYAPGSFIQPGKDIPNGPVRLKITLQDDEVVAISDESKFLWVFGYLSFKDSIIGDVHQYRFCAKWQAFAPQPDGTLMPTGFVYDGKTPAAYTKRLE